MTNSNNGPHILIGNGFNLALHSSHNQININYGYEKILEKAREQLQNNNSSNTLLTAQLIFVQRI